MLAASVEIDMQRMLATVHLSASKTDPRALSVHRTWGCVCVDDNKAACAFHASVEQRALIVVRCPLDSRSSRG